MIRYAIGAIKNDEFVNLFKDQRTYKKKVTAKRVLSRKQEYVEVSLVVKEVEVETLEDEITQLKAQLKREMDCVDLHLPPVFNPNCEGCRESLRIARETVKMRDN